MRIELDNKPIIFYDGECALCNWSVQILIKNDNQGKFIFISLQHPKSINLLDTNMPLNGNSVLLLFQGKISTKSTAIFNTFKILGGWWRILVLFKIIPKSIRDSIYDFFAKNRKKWFGSTNYCRLPNNNLYF